VAAISEDETEAPLQALKLSYAGTNRIRFQGYVSAPGWEHPRFVPAAIRTQCRLRWKL